MELDDTTEYRRGRSMTKDVNVRSARATSTVPANLSHYDELDAASEYFDNSGLHRARRALSEARNIIREASVGRESVERELSTVHESQKTRKSRLEMVKESTEISKGEGGMYKMTITPKAEYWSQTLPARYWYSQSSELTDALLSAYSPRNFPNFVFGKFGPGKKLGDPISSTMDYYKRPAYYDLFGRDGAELSRGMSSRRELSSLGREMSSARETSACRSSAREGSRNVGIGRESTARDSGYKMAAKTGEDDYMGNLSSANGFESALKSERDRSTYQGRYNSSVNSYEATYLGKKNRINKFAHYLIPKHYEGTPMLGGYLLPKAHPYVWTY